MIRERDFAVVAARCKPAAERLGGIVRRVRVVVVEPGEVRPRSRREPAGRGIRHLVGAALGALFARIALVKGFVKRVEPLRKSECGRHRVCAHECRRRISQLLQPHRDRRVAAPQREHDVATDAMRRRILAGHYRRVRGPGKRHGGVGAIEADAARSQGVERRRRAGRRAVRADVVGAKRVDRDEKDVGLRRSQRGDDQPRRHRGDHSSRCRNDRDSAADRGS